MVHIRLQTGRSIDVQERELSLMPDMSEAAIKESVARYLDLRLHELDSYVIDRPNGNLIIRPQAVYG